MCFYSFQGSKYRILDSTHATQDIFQCLLLVEVDKCTMRTRELLVYLLFKHGFAAVAI